MTTPHRLTLFTSTAGPLAKTYKLKADGTLEKSVAAELYTGTFEVKAFTDVHSLAALLVSTTHHQALSASLPLTGSTSGRVTTAARLAADPDAVARTRAHFGLPQAPGLLAIDCDEGGISRQALWEMLKQVAPSLALAGAVWRPSGSSHVHHGDQDRTGLRGQHLFVPTLDASDGPRVLKVLAARLWLAGYGRIAVSRSGSLLVRQPIDTAIADAARLLFTAGSLCEPPLEQRHRDPVILSDGPALDSRATIPDLSAAEAGRYEAMVAQAKAAAAPQAAAARDQHRQTTIARRLPSIMAQGVTAAVAEARIGEALEAAWKGTLTSDAELIHVTPDGKHHTVTVGQLLTDRERYHLATFLDPVNPEHRNSSPDAIAYLLQAHPIIWSLDDGGKAYRLTQRRHVLQSSRGARHELITALVGIVAELPEVFATDTGTVVLEGSRPVLITPERLMILIGSSAVIQQTTTKDKQTPIDVPREVAVLTHTALSGNPALKYLKAVNSLPFATHSGRIVSRPGYDPDTKTYLHVPPDYVARVPENPTPDQVRQALRTMMTPWLEYTWATPDDAAAMVSAVLTALSRHVIDIAPAYLFDAALQGSGKTLAASALGAVIEGNPPSVTPWTGKMDDVELEKRLLSAAEASTRFLCLDNVTGVLKSPTLSGVLSSGRIKGRRLGYSVEVSAHLTTLITLTSNQAEVHHDLTRKVVVARINAGDRPTSRQFDHTPVELALCHRVEIAEAAAVIIRAYAAAGSPTIKRGDAAYPQWNAAARQPVLWLECEGFTDALPYGPLGDPANTLLSDPVNSCFEIEALADALAAIHQKSGGEVFTAADLAKWCGSMSHTEIKSAILDTENGAQQVNSRSLGRWLTRKKDRPAGGLKLVGSKSLASKSMQWRVVSVA